MIRPTREAEDLDDDAFAEIIEKSYQMITSYLNNEFVYDFFAKCIVIDYKNNSIWEDSKLEYEFKDAMNYLSNMPSYKEISIEKLKEVLEKKHLLKLTSVDPIRIEEIK